MTQRILVGIYFLSWFKYSPREYSYYVLLTGVYAYSLLYCTVPLCTSKFYYSKSKIAKDLYYYIPKRQHTLKGLLIRIEKKFHQNTKYDFSAQHCSSIALVFSVHAMYVEVLVV